MSAITKIADAKECFIPVTYAFFLAHMYLIVLVFNDTPCAL